MTPPRAGRPGGRTDAIYACTSMAPPTRCSQAWRDGDATVGGAGHRSAGEPRRRVARLAPRLVELCFQTAGVAELAIDGSLGLAPAGPSDQVAPGAAEATARWAVVTTGEAGGSTPS